MLRGSHHAMEEFYRMQRDRGGILGPEGPAWPRLDHDAPNRCGLVYLPAAVREQFLGSRPVRHADGSVVQMGPECTPDGKAWPRPTQCCMEE